MKLNRKWLLAIALVLSLTMAVGGTLAFLTDRDSEANVFTMGNVEIDLTENFNQGAELIPGVDIEKKPIITNTGNTDAWVWATIAIPAALDNEDASKNVVHFNYAKESVGAGLWNWQGDGDWMIETVKKDGVDYNVYTVLYQSVLEPGASTPAVMTKVYMDDHIDIDSDGNLHHVEKGVVTDIDWNINEDGNPIIYVSAYAMQTNEFDSVLDAYKAYNVQWTTEDGVNNGIEWGNPIDPNAPTVGDDDSKTWAAPADAYEVDSTETLLEALHTGKTTILLKNGNYVWKSNAANDPTATAARNKTLNLYGESRDGVVIHNVYENGGDAGADYDFQGSTVNFYGLTLSTERNTYGNYEGWAYMTATYNDCVIKDNYTLYGDSTFNYCTLNVSGDKYNIWTWGAKNVTFDHCTFNSDGKALLVYNQSCNVKVSNCLFNDNGGLDTTKAAIETGTDPVNGNYNHTVKHNIVVTNTKVNGYAINTTNCDKVTTNLWANKNGLDTDHLNVVVDGADVY